MPITTTIPSRARTSPTLFAAPAIAPPNPFFGAFAEPFCIESMRSPAAYCFGCLLPPTNRRYHATFSAATTFVSTMLAPHRRQNLRPGSFGSLHAPQIRSPGCAIRSVTVATGFGLPVVTTSCGFRDWIPSALTDVGCAAGSAARADANVAAAPPVDLGVVTVGRTAPGCWAAIGVTAAGSCDGAAGGGGGGDAGAREAAGAVAPDVVAPA